MRGIHRTHESRACDTQGLFCRLIDCRRDRTGGGTECRSRFLFALASNGTGRTITHVRAAPIRVRRSGGDFGLVDFAGTHSSGINFHRLSNVDFRAGPPVFLVVPRERESEAG